MAGATVSGNGANAAQQLKSKLSSQSNTLPGKNDKQIDGAILKMGMPPSAKETQRQDYGDKNIQGDKAGLGTGANAAKGEKGKAKKEKEAVSVVKKKKNK